MEDRSGTMGAHHGALKTELEPYWLTFELWRVTLMLCRLAVKTNLGHVDAHPRTIEAHTRTI